MGVRKTTVIWCQERGYCRAGGSKAPTALPPRSSMSLGMLSRSRDRWTKRRPPPTTSVKAVLAAFRICTLLGSFVLLGCDFYPCGDDVLSDVKNISGQRLVSFARNCGATTPLAMHLAILSPEEKVTRRTEPFFVGEDPCTITATWQERDAVLVQGRCERVFRQAREHRGFQILYEIEEGPSTP